MKYTIGLRKGQEFRNPIHRPFLVRSGSRLVFPRIQKLLTEAMIQVSFVLHQELVDDAMKFRQSEKREEYFETILILDVQFSEVRNLSLTFGCRSQL